MADISIDADALFRAVTSHDYKLLAYYLDLRSGELTSRTLTEGEVNEPPPGPSVKPLPPLGGELARKQGDDLFGQPSDEAPKKTDLFGTDDGPKKAAFEGDFWKRDGDGRKDPFGEGGYKRTSAAKKLAGLFGEDEAAMKEKAQGGSHARDPFGGREEKRLAPQAPKKTQPTGDDGENSYAPIIDADDPLHRIPVATYEQVLEWHRVFAAECGDPKIKERLEKALRAAEPLKAFERALRQYQRSEEQWNRYYRKMALHFARAWLQHLPLSWEIVDE